MTKENDLKRQNYKTNDIIMFSPQRHHLFKIIDDNLYSFRFAKDQNLENLNCKTWISGE